MYEEPVDLLIAGGGVNGTGVARDAAGRGVSVVLCEQDDLAAWTSSSSSKLIHGGLRYLEHYEFRLVREALAEREVLLRSAPHILHPLRFVLPHHAGLRPGWMLRAGLLLYDHLGGRRSLPGTRRVNLETDPTGEGLKPQYRRGFEYSDAAVDDSRLVALLAVDAAERGARILTRTALTQARRDAGVWRCVLERRGGERQTVTARALVNAAGPWVETVRGLTGVAATGNSVKLVKGSHIVVPRMYPGEQAYTLQGADGRVVFAIPYQGRFTLVGTTDVPYDGDPAHVDASAEEIGYLCRTLGDYFEKPPTPADVAWAYAGVRPLFDDGEDDASAVTRDYVLDVDSEAGAPPLLTIYGGKITTFRRLAEHALEKLQGPLGFEAGPWTADARLPGGDLPGGGFERFRGQAADRYPWLAEPTLSRMCHAYGSRIDAVLAGATAWSDLGEDHGAGLTGREVRYLVEQEWAREPEDVLWRRTKLGLHMSPAERAAFMAAPLPSVATA
ncbi:glycerol-3-phosphate dehydrogenase [uncultured Phenylobacterium sp.]|uniref:glycerol-3-phosphate dehydrogenase n=1 Tax=uncultured Phenylobacterium sp. TaxID=349273 RepID=UPI0025E177C8|nr:glycerol-3-phosphate dehydrogenase [uncultured Phenylobacterium sp.]